MRLPHLLFLASALIVAPAFGQVTLAPTFLYVESPVSYGTITLTNASEQVQEVFIDFEFGYPAADETGRRYLEYNDAAAEAAFSLSPWVRSFPEQIRIPPKHRQVVRLMIDAPRALNDGVYWTRMVVTSREERPPVAGAAAQVNFEFKQVIPIVLDHGAKSTSVEVADLVVDPSPQQVNLLAVLKRTGDEPFFGSIELRVFDDAGREVERIATTTEAYYRSSTYFTIDRSDLAPGRYEAEIALRAERSDVRKGGVPDMEPVLRRFEIDIPKPGPLRYEAR